MAFRVKDFLGLYRRPPNDDLSPNHRSRDLPDDQEPKQSAWTDTFASGGNRSVKLTQLMPIENCVINGYSLIENVFGANIVVYDVLGVMQTTAKNVKLLGRAQTLLENRHCYDAQGLASALKELREEADFIDQSEYGQAVWRERLDAEPPRIAATRVGGSA